MGDVGEAFKEWREVVKAQKEDRHSKNMEIINQSGINYKTDPSRTILIKTKLGIVCFYPTVNKFMLKGKVYYGDARSYLNFIKKRETLND